MTLKDRFLDYWHTDAYSDYKYDLSIFEQIAYGLIGGLGGVVWIVAVLIGCPLWIIPYLIYKSIKVRKEST